jgi:ketosteroid isomerase-like protein
LIRGLAFAAVAIQVFFTFRFLYFVLICTFGVFAVGVCQWGSFPFLDVEITVVEHEISRFRVPAQTRMRSGGICGCTTSTQPALQQIRHGMAETNKLFNTEVFGKRNFDALDQIYTSEARILPPGAPMISGRNGIKQFWSNLVQSVNAKSAVLESVDVIPAGDGVVEIGRATLSVGAEGQTANEMEVKYVVHWKQEDGRWKWNVDIWNTNS